MINKTMRAVVITALIATLGLTTACGTKSGAGTSSATGNAAANTVKKLTGEIKVDGSSTVGPITQVAAEEFNKIQKDVKIPVGVSGTGGGLKKFAAGEVDIANASRKIKDAEAADAKAKGVEYVEFQIAYDGITVVVNKENTWLKEITVAELKQIWEPNSKVTKWKDVNPAWPDAPVKLYGPGMDSGTLDFFTEKINGKEKDIRKDYTPSEDDNILVKGVEGDKYAMGFFGFAYYDAQKAKLNAVSIKTDKGSVAPSLDSIKNLTYQPLSRPLFIYVSKASLQKEHVKEFVKFYLENAKSIVSEADYVPMNDYTAELAKLK